MQEISDLHSESPKSHVIDIITAIGVNAAHVEGAADDLAVGSQTILPVIAPVGVTNVVGISGAANASVTSLDLDHDLIDLIELRSGRVERLRSVVTSGDTLGSVSVSRVSPALLDVLLVVGSSITTVGAIGASAIVILVVVTVVSAALVVAMFVVSISADGLNTNRVEGVVSGG
jgi:hypothetical protein